jgi:cation:H+ antiporter
MGDFALVLVGVLGLWVGTEVAVRSGGEIGRRLGLSEMFLGLTVFAIGTDLSELLVAVQGAVRLRGGVDTSGLVVGNALGRVLAQGRDGVRHHHALRSICRHDFLGHRAQSAS